MEGVKNMVFWFVNIDGDELEINDDPEFKK